MNSFHSRFCQDILALALRSMPVVVVSGARQTGKTTLVHKLLDQKRKFFTLDQLDVLQQAKTNPDSLLSELPLTIDEVQRAPELLLAIKRKVDSNRVNGSILLTGSANLALMSSVSESLAGRAVYLELPPFSPVEWCSTKSIPSLIDSLFEDKLDLARWENIPSNWIQWALTGGYPSAIQASNLEERQFWFSGYVQTYLERDLRQLAQIDNLVDFQKVMSLAANRVGRLLNQSELARDAAVSQPTCHRYLNLLETGYQIVNLHNYTTNPSQGIIKSKKLFWTDIGLATYLAKIYDEKSFRNRPDLGFWLEQAVFQTLQTWKSLGLNRNIYYWRSASKHEVDFLLEFQNKFVAIEIKSSEFASPSDLKGLHLLKQQLANKGHDVRSIILHPTNEGRLLDDNMYSLPIGPLFPQL